MSERNVLGEPLEPCGSDPVTGYFRDGCCRPDPEGIGSHLVCAVVTADFLEHQVSIGNDLVTPMPHYGFPGLTPGDRWCVTVANWRRAYEDGAASKRHLIERAGFGAAAAVVGDTEADIPAARALGLASVGVTTGCEVGAICSAPARARWWTGSAGCRRSWTPTT